MFKSIPFYELALFHALVIGWALWELRKTNRLIHKREESETEIGDEPDDGAVRPLVENSDQRPPID